MILFCNTLDNMKIYSLSQFVSKSVTVHGLKLEIGNWEEQYKSMKAKFPILISMFRECLPKS